MPSWFAHKFRNRCCVVFRTLRTLYRSYVYVLILSQVANYTNKTFYEWIEVGIQVGRRDKPSKYLTMRKTKSTQQPKQEAGPPTHLGPLPSFLCTTLRIAWCPFLPAHPSCSYPNVLFWVVAYGDAASATVRTPAPLLTSTGASRPSLTPSSEGVAAAPLLSAPLPSISFSRATLGFRLPGRAGSYTKPGS